MEGPKVAIRGLNAVAALLAAKKAFFFKKTPITEATAMRIEAFYSLVLTLRCPIELIFAT